MGSGKAKMAREVRLRSKVESGKGERSVPSMMAVSTWMERPVVRELLFQWVLAVMVARFAEMKSALMSTAEMWRDG